MKHLLFLLSVVLLTFSIQAEESTNADIDSRYEYYHLKYKINDDLSHIETHETAEKILKENALRYKKETSVSYSNSIQKLRILDAYTKKSDGRIVKVPNSNFQERKSVEQADDSQIFSDYNTIRILFPDVEVGDTVVLSYEIKQSEPMFPGYFSMSAAFPKIYAYDDVTIEFDYPKSLDVDYSVREMTKNEKVNGDRKQLKLSYKNSSPAKSKRRNYSVWDPEQEPGYIFTTFKSYKELADVYGKRAIPKAQVTEQITKLSNEIVGNEKDTKEQVKLLYEWVGKNITYKGNCIGVGAVVPRDIDVVLKNKIGDCKDHATLLQALLASKNIKSTQALVNASSEYKLRSLPTADSVNHVINYIPSLDLYLDSTNGNIPFDMLPMTVSDKPVLLVENYKEGIKTPPISADQNVQTTIINININSEGNAKGYVDINQKGIYSLGTRMIFQYMKSEYEEMLIENLLISQGMIGSGTIQKDDPNVLSSEYNYKISFDINNYVQTNGSGAFFVSNPISLGNSIKEILKVSLVPVEDFDTFCAGGTLKEKYEYNFPKGFDIIDIPKNLMIDEHNIKYSETYKLDGNKLSVSREIIDSTPGNICKPDYVKKYQEIALKINKNLNSQVLYKNE